jgi:hypothetical protein
MSNQTHFSANQSEKVPQQIIESPIPTMTGYFENAEEKREFISNIFDNTATDTTAWNAIGGQRLVVSRPGVAARGLAPKPA